MNSKRLIPIFLLFGLLAEQHTYVNAASQAPNSVTQHTTATQTDTKTPVVGEEKKTEEKDNTKINIDDIYDDDQPATTATTQTPPHTPQREEKKAEKESPFRSPVQISPYTSHETPTIRRVDHLETKDVVARAHLTLAPSVRDSSDKFRIYLAHLFLADGSPKIEHLTVAARKDIYENLSSTGDKDFMGLSTTNVFTHDPNRPNMRAGIKENFINTYPKEGTKTTPKAVTWLMELLCKAHELCQVHIPLAKALLAFFFAKLHEGQTEQATPTTHWIFNALGKRDDQIKADIVKEAETTGLGYLFRHGEQATMPNLEDIIKDLITATNSRDFDTVVGLYTQFDHITQAKNLIDDLHRNQSHVATIRELIEREHKKSYTNILKDRWISIDKTNPLSPYSVWNAPLQPLRVFINSLPLPTNRCLLFDDANQKTPQFYCDLEHLLHIVLGSNEENSPNSTEAKAPVNFKGGHCLTRKVIVNGEGEYKLPHPYPVAISYEVIKARANGEKVEFANDIDKLDIDIDHVRILAIDPETGIMDAEWGQAETKTEERTKKTSQRGLRDIDQNAEATTRKKDDQKKGLAPKDAKKTTTEATAEKKDPKQAKTKKKDQKEEKKSKSEVKDTKTTEAAKKAAAEARRIRAAKLKAEKLAIAARTKGYIKNSTLFPQCFNPKIGNLIYRIFMSTYETQEIKAADRIKTMDGITIIKKVNQSNSSNANDGKDEKKVSRLEKQRYKVVVEYPHSLGCTNQKCRFNRDSRIKTTMFYIHEPLTNTYTIESAYPELPEKQATSTTTMVSQSSSSATAATTRSTSSTTNDSSSSGASTSGSMGTGGTATGTGSSHSASTSCSVDAHKQ